MSTVLEGIPHYRVGFIWPLVMDLIEKPLVRTEITEDYSPDDIKKFLMSRDMQLWVVYNDEGRVVCATVTQIIQYPGRKVLGIPFVGADKGTIDTCIKHFDVIKSYAKGVGCSIIRGWGRAGWVKLLEPDVTRVEFDIVVGADENLH